MTIRNRDLAVPSNSASYINDKLGQVSGFTRRLTDDGLLDADAINGVLAEDVGGTGEAVYADGELLIGNGTTTGLDRAALTAGANVTITNGPGSIEISVGAGGGLGDVSGPASSTTNHLAQFADTTGKLISDAGKGVPTGNIVGDTDAQTLTNKTLTTPTIASFTNATHSHQNAAGGGTLDAAAIAAGKLALARGGTNADLSATGGASQVLKQTSAGGAVSVGQLASTDISGLGTAATTAATDYLSSSTSSTQTGYFGDVKLKDDTSPSHYLTLTDAENLTADHTLSLNVNNADRTVSLSGNLTVPSAATVSGTNTGDQTISLNSDVTGSGTGSITATIANGAVTLAKQADVATSTVFYRKTAGTGAPEVNTLATLKTDLGLTGTNSGDQTITLTGDVTGTGTGSFAATVANDAVTYAKMQNISATQRALGRNTAGSGDTEEVTASQILDWIGSTRGAVLYRGSGGWTVLAPGTSGYALVSNGAGADPSYSNIAPGSSAFATAMVGQVFASVTKTNIGNAYVDIYATAFDDEDMMVIDFTGATHARVVYIVDYVGTGSQQYRWVDAADNTNVLIEAAAISADADAVDTGWVALPAAFANSTKTVEMQGKSTVAGDDPVVKGYALFLKYAFANLVTTPLSRTYGGTGVDLTTIARGDILVANSSPALSRLALGSAGQIIRSNGNDPVYSTATYPATTTANQILYSSAANTIGEITAAANSVLITNASNVPSLTSTTWTARTFAAGNYTGNGSMTVTVDAGDVTTDAYVQIGKTMTYAFYVTPVTIGGTVNTTIQIAIPNSGTAAKTIQTMCRIIDGGAFQVGVVGVAAGATTIGVQKLDGSNWTLSTNATLFIGEITFELQ